MSFEKFFDAISRLLPIAGLKGKEEELSRLDPDKIYIENVRSVLGVSAHEAERICESAARQGVFDRYVEVICPDGVVAVTAEDESLLPDQVPCWTTQDGDLEEVELSVDSLQKRVYYRLHEQPAASTNR